MNLCPLMTVTISVDLDGAGYVVENLEPNVSARGETASEALANLAATLREPQPRHSRAAVFEKRLRKVTEWVAARTGATLEEARALVDLTVAKRGIESLEAEKAGA